MDAALASIVMMFAGLTSAYVVKRTMANWITFELPAIFYYSTAVIIFSSLTVMLSRNAFQAAGNETIQALAGYYFGVRDCYLCFCNI